ncbi:hypothetical protein PCL_11249 [Purpureocillium lilacinum]|uniref:Uncharacterized protein n=1 Tax=Purpureocillium lilacinum TaxID=33203 RepID=A0A2U3DQ07_PURLI|nr:hypothetical protein PCL_11249 [Purpureocillium lilacinum]
MSTFQLDDNDAPITTHVDMGKIIPPRTGSKASDMHQHKSADANRQMNGPTHNSKPDGAEQCETQQEDVRSDKVQQDRT